MNRWWLRPAVRIAVALVLPAAVPAIITLLIWALPGDPASIICPPQSCGGTAALADRWHLNSGPWAFYQDWVSRALQGDFGNSWRLQQGVAVMELLREAIPTTLGLLFLGLLPIVIATVGAATGRLPAKVDPVAQVVGLVPAVVMALVGAAIIEITYGSMSFEGTAGWMRLGAGALVLGFADGAFSATVAGVRSLFQSENKQRYARVAQLRGERRLDNTLPNVAPALAGQLRARVLHLVSGLVVVEVVLRLDGIGDLLWGGTLLQDFGVVLAAATGFAALSAALLALQAVVEVLVALHVRRTPPVPGRAA